MPNCKWRDKPGSEELCKTLPEPGSAMCPRHLFLHKLREDERLQKERTAQIKRQVVTRNPTTRQELLEYGFVFSGTGRCRACEAAIEWWLTPNAKNAPYNPMPDLESQARSHFATCTRAAELRRAS